MPNSRTLVLLLFLTAPRLAHPSAAYVPLDSWVYDALDRLAAFGLVRTEISGLRPWTRAECSRQLQEAERRIGAQPDDEAAGLVARLQFELAEDPRSAVVLESVSVRALAIAGEPLNDSFHFGQTIVNDFGRPYGRGFNGIAGVSLRGGTGRFFGGLRAEAQQAGALVPYSLDLRDVVARLDNVPAPPERRTAPLRRGRLLDAYLGVQLGKVLISAGKQILWYGPTLDAPLSFSNNAEPSKNVRLSLARPVELRGPWGFRGAVQIEATAGKLGGHRYTWRPWFNSQKVSLRLTENLELGFTRWSLLWGKGHPITLGSLADNLLSTNSPRFGADPGDRKGGFDFRYRLPGLRRRVILYSDSYADDDPSPLAAPRRAAFSPGLYVTRLPGLPRLDLRVESASTLPAVGDYGGQFVYYNSSYRSGNTNYGNLIGNSVGRDGRVVQAWSGYRFGPRSRILGSFRHRKIGAAFLPGGGTQAVAGLTTEQELSPGRQLSAGVQLERYLIPVLGAERHTAAAWVRFDWEPRLTWGR